MAYGFNDDKSKSPVSFKSIDVSTSFPVTGQDGDWTIVHISFNTPAGYIPIGVVRKHQWSGGGDGPIVLDENGVTFWEISNGTTRTVHPIAIVYFMRADMIEND